MRSEPEEGLVTHRREALGRNRRSPERPRTVAYAIAGIVLLGGGGFAAYLYFTAPERVFGSKALDCPPTSVTWQKAGDGGVTVISGCGRSVDALCQPDVCWHGAAEVLDQEMMNF